MSIPVIRSTASPRFEVFPAVDRVGTNLDLSEYTVYFVYRINKQASTEVLATVFGDSNEGAFVYLSPDDLATGYIEWLWKIVDGFGNIEYTKEKRKAQIRIVF